MQQLSIHPNGPKFSRIVTGAWRWDKASEQTIDQLIHTSLDAGMTTFDHADIYGNYGNEASFGAVLAKQPGLVNKMQLVSKCGIKLLSARKPEHRVKHYDTSYEHILRSAETSLSLLHTDHLDLLLIHRPDPLMNVDEIAKAFSKLKKEGKVLHFGVSNFTNTQFDLLQSVLSFPLVTNQIEMSLFYTAPFFDGTLDHLYKLKTSPMAWSPLGGGKTFVAEDETTRRLKPVFQSLSEKHNGATMTQLLISWLLKHPSNILPVIGTTKPERVVEAAVAMKLQLDEQDWFELLQAARGREVA